MYDDDEIKQPKLVSSLNQRTHDVMITSLLRQNDVETSFWRFNDVIITSYVRWQGLSPLWFVNKNNVTITNAVP